MQRDPDQHLFRVWASSCRETRTITCWLLEIMRFWQSQTKTMSVGFSLTHPRLANSTLKLLYCVCKLWLNYRYKGDLASSFDSSWETCATWPCMFSNPLQVVSFTPDRGRVRASVVRVWARVYESARSVSVCDCVHVQVCVRVGVDERIWMNVYETQNNTCLESDRHCVEIQNNTCLNFIVLWPRTVRQFL
jgi:hypothetical protein